MNNPVTKLLERQTGNYMHRSRLEKVEKDVDNLIELIYDLQNQVEQLKEK